MKARPCKLVSGQGYVSCPKDEATHLTLNLPGPVGHITLPVIQSGLRKDTGCWTWNGDTEAPTLRPSVLSEGTSYGDIDPYVKENWIAYRCHTWINDGNVIFLDDTSHDLRGQTLSLLDVNERYLS